MIKSFIHKGLKRFFTAGERAGIDSRQSRRIERLLDRLDAASTPEDMNVPGFDFHSLKGDRKGMYAVSVSGNWRITFRFAGGDAIEVNLEDYH